MVGREVHAIVTDADMKEENYCGSKSKCRWKEHFENELKSRIASRDY